MKNIVLTAILAFASVAGTIASAEVSSLKEPSHLFYVVMENQSEQNMSISFKKVSGDVSLNPGLADFTPLAAHQSSEPYEVVFGALAPSDKFTMVFTGQKDCALTIGFFGPGNPTVSIAGYGCDGAGYKVAGNVLFLYATGIHLA